MATAIRDTFAADLLATSQKLDPRLTVSELLTMAKRGGKPMSYEEWIKARVWERVHQLVEDLSADIFLGDPDAIRDALGWEGMEVMRAWLRAGIGEAIKARAS